MGEKTKIEWAHHTFNPWLGCTKVGPGCDNCYAEAWAKRSGLVKWGFRHERRRTTAANWRKPLAWNAEAERLGIRYRVFCASLADVFDNVVPPEWRYELYDLIDRTPHLDWLLLTKRIGNVLGMTPAPLPSNVWIGATICNQEEADRDIPKLLEVPAKVRFLSIEPLLGPVSLRWLQAWPENAPSTAQNPSGITDHLDGLRRLDWIIVGGESGPNARPMHPDWAYDLRNQCEAAGVPFLFKQWGEWQVASAENGHHDCNMTTNKAWWLDIDGTMAKPSCADLSDRTIAMVKVGKKRAGRLLERVQHDGYPIVGRSS